MKRREFLASTAATFVTIQNDNANVFETLKKHNKLGIQLFSVPRLLSTDLIGGLTMLAKLGFKEIETFGPFEFSAQSSKEGWKAAEKMLGFTGSGLYGKSPLEFKQILNDLNLKNPGTHTDLDTLENNMGALAEAAQVLGWKYVTLPAIPAERRANIDDYKKMADTFNIIGANAKKYGLKLGYHNHGYGIKPMNGKVGLDVIIENTDPALLYLEMDVFWTVAGGASPVDYLKKYPNRYKMLHIKDMKEKKTFAGDGGGMNDWMPMFPLMASAGEGVLNVAEIIKVAKKVGVEHYFVEQDMVANPEIALGKSALFLGKRL